MGSASQAHSYCLLRLATLMALSLSHLYAIFLLGIIITTDL